jgi:subtilisin-like proprotein convertase family protein
LHDFLAAQPQTQARTELQSTNYTFEVNESLLCEFVGVRVVSDHSGRGDLQIVLTSPSGTRSFLQRVNQDTLPGPSDWTYYSVQHFYESSYGKWTLQITDEDDKGTGSILSATLLLNGVAVTDSDHDGLDDAWELQHFGTLNFGPADDPDGDGYSNAREQIMGTDPNEPAKAIQLDLSVWDGRLARLSWSSNTNTVYRIDFGEESVAPLTVATNIPGRFRQTEWFLPYTNLFHQFFRIQAVPKGN